MCAFDRWAFCPTRTIVRKLGSSGIKPLRSSTPWRSSLDVTLRVPFQPPTTFQMTVRSRGKPALIINSNIASAVGSSLFREMKPDPAPAIDVIRPGFSKRNRTSALQPPSNGSKSGNSRLGCKFLSAVTYFLSGAKWGAWSISRRKAAFSGERSERATSTL